MLLVCRSPFPPFFGFSFGAVLTIPDNVSSKPRFTTEQAAEIAGQNFAVFGTAKELDGEGDQNFLIESPGENVVLKISGPHISQELLEFENQALRLAQAITDFDSPVLLKSIENQVIIPVANGHAEDGPTYLVRCISFVPGTPLAKFSPHSVELLAALGRSLALLTMSLSKLNGNPTAKRDLHWDLARSPAIVRESIPMIDDAKRSSLLHKLLANYDAVAERVDSLPKGVIHNDANDYNWLIDVPDGTDTAVIGLIDFGDAVFSTKLNDLAICAAYLMLDKQNVVDALCAVARGYHEIKPLDDVETSVLFPLSCMRLAQSVCIANQQKRMQPENEYLTVTEQPAWLAIERLAQLDPTDVAQQIRQSCNKTAVTASGYSFDRTEILRLRERHISPSLSLAYESALRIVQGKGQYLYDASGVTYLDCVNNVCHVGHSNPVVVKAIADQAAALNTNTRYLHPNLVQLGQRLAQTMPPPLEVCFFVNSGSEANDLALRLARTKTGRNDIVVVDHAYHGHTAALIDISPYKFNRIGGAGKPDHVHVLPMPDGFRGEFHYEDVEHGKKYAAQAVKQIDAVVETGGQIAAFIAESMLSCGGQIELPAGYLAAVYEAVRRQGGVCIADEVQVGFGRVGDCFWGFELQQVVPDIVTVGKPFGNGHPLAAVVTTREIADTFNNGMEYFNTFGGNPVSCAAGLAVLDVIVKEDLQSHAKQIGDRMTGQLKDLQARHSSILGDVRGKGLFMGLEFVQPGTRLPNVKIATKVKQQMLERKILLSTDGPNENVIKFKPPMIFDQANADRVVENLEVVLEKFG